jgi:hypothetical protein
MRCDHCFHGELVVDTSKVLLSYPPKYQATCKECGHIQYPLCSEVEERLKKARQ